MRSEILAEVNTRQAGQPYICQQTAIEILGSKGATKQFLTPDMCLFLLLLLKMAIKEVTDVLNLINPAYSLMFLLTNPSSIFHAKESTDAGCLKPADIRINQSFGGKTDPLRCKIIAS